MFVLNYCHGGYDGDIVSVEADLRMGIPGIDIVGMADVAIKESADRVRIAVRNSGLEFPRGRIAVNLAPAGIRKEGAYFDLSVAVSILYEFGTILPNDFKVMVLGELELSGRLRGVKGILSAVMAGKSAGVDFFIVPVDNYMEACSSQFDNIYPCSSLSETVDTLNRLVKNEHISVSVPELVSVPDDTEQYGDVSDIIGQAYIKKALLTAAAGRHNIILFGPPGSGKTMSAMRLVTILGDLDYNRSVETTRIHSVAGILRPCSGLVKRPPFRMPHHSSSLEGIIGGGRLLRPGEISLAHNGVLFLDEAPEFRKSVLQSLREPIERHRVDLARAGRVFWYPADFQLIMTANPCPCGNRGKADGVCMCSNAEVVSYWKRLGGALLDRIDMRIPVRPLSSEELLPDFSGEESDGFTSMDMRKIVTEVALLQRERFQGTDIVFNSEIPPGKISRYIQPDREGKKILADAVKKFSLSARACHSILKLSRTLADIDGKPDVLISKDFLLQAIQMRRYGDSDFFWN